MKQKFVLWGTSAAVAIPVYAAGNAVDVPSFANLVLTFAGAIFGAFVGAAILQRL